ncbi:surface antigen BspA-like [Trichomonas vaginalis G3]|uniref:Surface antigen BspA-like n=1 Tax=Trichomonas vaginalis (strain ATCC PRA-98 / G3) TaxID=412133 RepID=A2FX98_TRIV3|nr:islet amyloid polypeptide processing [Trichomonas vaginalis G3]EAX90469.1 surface antigen BspA-like [Trichomonas vaginalis G3]KAI5496322.1 islet amyloid polypeptide processing [Trichomonas vaginalis G3]|eukprot:XP_001303399.1 surface antigen BspA-like [Trichomonas vaginalis G3]
MAAPCGDNAPIAAAGTSKKGVNVNFTTANASAAIFAGGLAVLMEANPKLKLSDLFYVTAFTADKVYPGAINWEQNGVGLNFNRRFGFGRLNLGRAVDIALNWSSTGNFYLHEVHKVINKALPDTEYNVTFDFNVSDAKSILTVGLFFHSRKFAFGSLNPHIISPSGTRCEMKLLTDSDKTTKIRSVDLNSYKFLGENPNGIWTVSFRIADYADHGTIEDIGLRFYYTKIAPNYSKINNRICSSPYRINQSKVTFLSPNITLEAAKSATVPLQIDKCVRNSYKSIWLSTPDGELNLLFLIFHESLSVCPETDNLTIIDGISEISSYQYANCTNIKAITFPNTLKQIGIGAFMNCSNLLSLEFPSILSKINEKSFSECVNLQTITFHSDNTVIYSRAFQNCINLKEIQLPNSLVNIDSYVFYNCTNIGTITLPDTVSTIGDYSFYNCQKLNFISFPSELIFIGEHAFDSCYNIKTFVFPPIFMGISNSAFISCIGLEKVEFLCDNCVINQNAFEYCYNLSEIKLPNQLYEISENMFAFCHSLKSITLPNEIKEIKKSAFYFCYKLEEINFPKHLNKIGQEAFRNCFALINIIIPENAKEIEEKAFQNCKNI